MITAKDAYIQSSANHQSKLHTIISIIDNSIKEAIELGKMRCTIHVPEDMNEVELLLVDYGYVIRKVTITSWEIYWDQYDY